MRRKLHFRLKRTPRGFSGYLRGGTKYVWVREKISHKRILSAR